MTARADGPLAGRVADALYRATADTLERLAFVFAMPEIAPRDGVDLEAETAAVDVRGSFRGRLTISVPAEALADLAANILGRLDPPSVDERRDALGELANVVCGNALPLLLGPGAAFRLDGPRVGPTGAPDGTTLLGSASLPIEAGPVRVALYGDAAARAALGTAAP